MIELNRVLNGIEDIATNTHVFCFPFFSNENLFYGFTIIEA